MRRGEEFVRRARAMIGTPFRPQGRTADGLDCVGFVARTYGIDDNAIPRDYRLSGDHLVCLQVALSHDFRKVVDRRPGDLLLFQAGPRQFHLAIASDIGLIHADAGIRRVVERPGEAPWVRIGIYRKRIRTRG